MGRQPLPTDTILGNGNDQYRIDTVLGPGGFGVTYLARDLRFDRDVAIKEYFPAEFAYREGTNTLRSSTRGSQQDYFEQGKRYFLDEARTLAKFRHEHIVRVLNLIEQNNTAYMVLEFEEGQSLKNWLRTLGRAPTQQELDGILVPMLAALDVVHAKGMFHRDIAPDNIIIRPNAQPVLIDFGAARHFVREHSHTIGAIVKHGYSPPEQYTLDTKLQGAWSDIYSLSATLYTAIMGVAPEEASRRQLNDTMLPIEKQLEARDRAAFRPAFLAALNAGLALKPRDRPQTIASFRALLERSAVAAYVPDDLADDDEQQPATGGARSGAGTASQLRRGGDGRTGQSRVEGSRVSARVAELGARSHVRGFTSGPGNNASALSASVRAVPAGLDSRPLETGEATPNTAAYPEAASRTAGIIALTVAALAAVGFLAVGGIEHPGGLAAAFLVCVGLLAAGLERMIAMSRASPDAAGPAAVTAAIMMATALAIYWLPLFLWPISLILAGVAVLFSQLSYGKWVPVSLLSLALIHLAVAALLMALAARSVQKDPYFLPLMGASLAVLAGLILASALHIQRRWEIGQS